MGRHTVFQGNESPQPLQLEPGPNSAIPSQPSAPLATAQTSKNPNVHQRVELLALDSGVLQLREMLYETANHRTLQIKSLMTTYYLCPVPTGQLTGTSPGD